MSIKITATIITLIALVIGLAVLMNYAKFENTFNGLTESRLGFLVQDLRDTLEFGLDLGLDPAAMTNTVAILTREAAQDPHILSILVFDDESHILHRYQSDLLKDHPLAAPAPAWLEAVLHTTAKTPRHTRDLQTLMVGVPLTNNFGLTVGGLILRYDRSFHDQELENTLSDLIHAALLILVAVSLITLASVWWLFRDTRRELRQVGAALEQFLENRRDESLPPDGHSVLEKLNVAAEWKSWEFAQRLLQASQILRLEQRLAGPARSKAAREDEHGP